MNERFDNFKNIVDKKIIPVLRSKVSLNDSTWEIVQRMIGDNNYNTLKHNLRDFIISLLPKKTAYSYLDKINMFDFEKAPLNIKCFSEVSRIASGSHTDVYLLEMKNEKERSYVFKIEFANKTTSVSEVQKIAKSKKDDFLFLQGYFDQIDGLIEEELIAVCSPSHNPEQMAIITVQRFAGFNNRDIFNDLSKEELLKTLSESEELRKNFLLFIEKTLELYNAWGIMVDILGYGNLILAQNDSSLELKLLDAHEIKNVQNDNYHLPVFIKKFNYLISIANSLGGNFKKVSVPA